MQYQNITSREKLDAFCDELRDAKTIAFDTEFVAEDTYRPDLCLIQVASEGKLAVIDTLAFDEHNRFWEMLVEGDHTTLVHAGREELRFCLHAVGKGPKNLFDVQLAAGFIGTEYPASYGNLIHKLLGKTLPKGETRTNWRNRPLSPQQIEYALQDVVDLELLQTKLCRRLEEVNRLDWVATEIESWQQNVVEQENSERWQRLPGLSGMSSRSLAIARELWRWRDGEAERRNMPAKRILRDDLLTELSKRQSADIQRIRAVRGLEHSRLQRHLETIADRIQSALDLSDDECPRTFRRGHEPQFTLLGQFLNTALASICRQQKVAPSLVGTVQDVRELVMHHLGVERRNSSPPNLMIGWRAEVVGRVLEDVMTGRLAIRVADAESDHPLTFQEVESQASTD
ncbi:MAG: ribonuclease D [Pirellulaceae bacterium]